MDIPPPAYRPMEWGNRLKRAALGFGVTLAPVFALACVQLLLAPNIVENAGFDPNADGWIVSDYRDGLVSGYAWVAGTVFAYWMLTLSLGRDQILGITSANVTLGASILTFALAMAIASVVPATSQLFKWACPILGLPDTMPALPSGVFSFDGQTSCEAFANEAVPIVLLGLPLVLLATSAILRIVLSRRRWRRRGG